MNNNEKWQSAAKQITTKPIKGWEDKYLITNDGKVFSIRNNKFLHPRISMDGYERVCLCNDTKRYEFRVHRLVAETFIENTNKLPQVNHKDYNTRNNTLDNLEWVDNYTNSHHSYDNGRFIRPENYKVYTFTNVFNNRSFSIIGAANVAYQFGCSRKNFMAIITKYANTGMYVKQGIFKGLRVDSEYLKVQRLSQPGVDSSESKCETSQADEDIV